MVVARSRSCRPVGVGVSSGSCLAVSAWHLGLSGASSLALMCSLCSLGRASWCGRSWVGIGVVCTRPHPSPAISRVSGGSGAASVLSWCRVSRACLRCVGYARAARCGPLVVSRPPGDLKNETNPHQVTLGRPPVTFGLRGAGFQSRFKNHRFKVDLPRTSIRPRGVHLGVDAPSVPFLREKRERAPTVLLARWEPPSATI